MRKPLLLLFLLTCLILPFLSKGQGIYQMHLQYANPGVTNILELVARIQLTSGPANRVNYSARTSNDTLYVTACYQTGPLTVALQITDTIPVGIISHPLSTVHFKMVNASGNFNCNSAASAIKIQPFLISGPTGIKPASNGLKPWFYPNPVNDYLMLKAPEVQALTIRDLTGKAVLKYPVINEDFSKIDVSSLKAGAYWIELVSKDGKTQTQRLLKN